MKSLPVKILCCATLVGVAGPAYAASEYYLVIDGVEGEPSTAIEVQSWSWGTSSASTGSSGVSGRPSVQASQNTQSLREAPSRPVLTASQNSQSLRDGSQPAGDLDGDGRADLSALTSAEEVQGFTLVLGPGAAARQTCVSGKHIKEAHIVGREGVFDLENITVSSCDSSGGAMALKVLGKTKEFKGHVTLLK